VSYSLRDRKASPPQHKAGCEKDGEKEAGVELSELHFGCVPEHNLVKVVIQEAIVMNRALEEAEVQTVAETVMNVEDSR